MAEMLAEAFGEGDAVWAAAPAAPVAHGLEVLIHAMMLQQPVALTRMAGEHLGLGFDDGGGSGPFPGANAADFLSGLLRRAAIAGRHGGDVNAPAMFASQTDEHAGAKKLGIIRMGQNAKDDVVRHHLPAFLPAGGNPP